MINICYTGVPKKPPRTPELTTQTSGDINDPFLIFQQLRNQLDVVSSLRAPCRRLGWILGRGHLWTLWYWRVVGLPWLVVAGVVLWSGGVGHGVLAEAGVGSERDG